MTKQGKGYLFSKTLKRHTVTLDTATVRKAKAIGRQNLSAGIRVAVQGWVDQKGVDKQA